MLRDNLPEYISAVREMGALLDAEQTEINLLDSGLEAILDEFRTETATEKTLGVWEDFLGFSRAPDWSVERRRERLKSRLITGGQLTAQRLKDVIEALGGVAVQITEYPDDYRIDVKFVGSFGIPRYLNDIKQELESIRPYHIGITYSFSYAYLRLFEGQTLDEFSGIALSQWSEMQPT